jgi:hypothetical protein
VSPTQLVRRLSASLRCKAALSVTAAIALATSSAAHAANTNVAVAANFTEPAKEIAQLFEGKTGHKAILSFGATGQFYAQITQAAPFQVFLSADQSTPKKLVDDGLAVGDSLFTYAIGKLVLYSANADLVKGEQTLRDGQFNKIAIANPTTAPARRRRRGDEGARRLRQADEQDRAGQQHRADLPVRRHRQRRARLCCAVAGDRAAGRLALIVAQNLYAPIKQTRWS